MDYREVSGHPKEKRHKKGRSAVTHKDANDQQLSEKRSEPDTSPSSVKDFTIADITQSLCTHPPDYLDVRDEQLCLALLDGVEHTMLDDMVAWYLNDDSIQADEKKVSGPMKWQYSKDPLDCYDYYAATGCPNCGTPYELDFPYAYHLDPPTLICLACGHRACTMHTYGESDTLVDRLENSSHTNSNQLSLINRSESQDKIPQQDDRVVYVRGFRERHSFGTKGKSWWQDRYLHKSIRMRNLNRTVALSMMSSLKAPTIKELCEICGNDEAFYTTYQARSADEGMTIMYECTRCHHRKTFNN